MKGDTVTEDKHPLQQAQQVFQLSDDPSIRVQGSVNDTKCTMLVDTGATATVVRDGLVKLMPHACMPHSGVLKTVSGATLPVVCAAAVKIRLGQADEFVHRVLVADIVDDCVLGMDFLRKHGYVINAGAGTVQVGPEVQVDREHELCGMGEETTAQLAPVLENVAQRVPVGQAQQATDVLLKFSDIFAANKKVMGYFAGVSHNIDVGGCAPLKQAPRRLPPHRLGEVDEMVAQMEEMGVIEPSSSPWASPIVLVKKKDGSTRFCIDYRKLNDITKKDSYPLPKIDEIVTSLGGSQWFSSLDLQNGYWQVPLAPEAKEKTAFCTPQGLWQFRVMPFGLCNAPATFQRAVESLFAAQRRAGTVRIYLDDVLICSPSFEQHLRDLDEVLSTVRRGGIKLNPKKCSFFKREVEYLGHVISAEGVAPNKDKTEAVAKWPVPTTAKQVQSFVSFCSYYRTFIPDYARMAEPLHRAQDASKGFVWTAECQAAFEAVKTALTTPPILAHPVPGAQYILDVDASGYAVGSVLSQNQQGVERVVAYYSKCLQKAERNYCVTRRELLSLIKALEHFLSYGLDSGERLIVRTDHASLTWLRNFRNPDGQLARWTNRLAPFNIELQYRSGKAHRNADGMSRRPCLGQGCRFCERAEEKDGWNDDDGVEWAFGMSLETELDWKTLQGADSVLKQVVQWKMDGQRPPWEQVSPHSAKLKAYWAMFDAMVLREGILTRVFEKGEQQPIYQVLVPAAAAQKVLEQCHLSGHFGERRMVAQLRRHFYWVGMHRDVRVFVRSCDTCRQRRGIGERKRAPLQNYVVGVPFERVAIDVMGPLPRSAAGNKFIVVVVDYFTKWPEAFAVPDQKAETVAEGFVRHVVSRFGVPREIHTDQGTNFESNVFEEVLRILGITRTRTTPMHPQGNGLVERFNRTLWQLLAKLVGREQTQWDRHLPMALLAYRATEHATTGFSPAMLTLGRELTLPMTLLCGAVPQQVEVTNYASQLAHRLDVAHQLARDRLLKAAAAVKKRYDARAAVPSINKGDQVWYFRPQRKVGVCPKLSSPWVGPCLVTKKITDVVYRIRLPSGKRCVVHADRLAPSKEGGREKC